MADLYRVTRPFMTYPEGKRRVLRAGAIVSSDDPAYAANKGAFEPLENSVERATAAPGELHRVSIPDPDPELEADEDEEVDVSQYHVGGGYYRLPDGRQVRGEDSAREALKD